MRFTFAVSTTTRTSPPREARAIVVDELERASFEWHSTGPVYEIRGDWQPVMEALHRAYRRLTEHAVSVNVHLTASSDHEGAFPAGVPAEDVLPAGVTEERVATSDDHVALGARVRR